MLMSRFEKIRQFLFGKRGEKKPQVKPSKPKPKSTKPCILTEEQCSGKGTSDIIKIYEPAFKEEGVHIPLAEPQPVHFPLSDEEKARLKAGLRYVWCDGFEAAEWRPRGCKYLGIRITDSFVLHETIVTTWEAFVNPWQEKCKARRITLDELRLLDAVWDEVSEMRIKAGDVALKSRYRFWFQEDEGQYFVLATRKGKVDHRYTEESAHLLMAVIN